MHSSIIKTRTGPRVIASHSLLEVSPVNRKGVIRYYVNGIGITKYEFQCQKDDAFRMDSFRTEYVTGRNGKVYLRQYSVIYVYEDA